MGLWDWSGPQDLSWASAVRAYPNQAAVLATEPNFKHEVVIALDTGIKYQGDQPVIGGWVYADGTPGPVIPPDPPAVNDSFTKVFMEFDGIEGSRTFTDTNASNIIRPWTPLGLSRITNQQFLFGKASAFFVGASDKITTNVISDLVFGTGPFTIRGYFKPNDPVGAIRGLCGMGALAAGLPTFWIDKYVTGQIRGAVVDTTGTLFQIFSTTVYSDTVNSGWHEFKFIRTGNILRLFLDNVQEGGDVAMTTTVRAPAGLMSISGYGQQALASNYVGWLDRFAVDIGIAR